jgi:hypothetical protein
VGADMKLQDQVNQIANDYNMEIDWKTNPDNPLYAWIMNNASGVILGIVGAGIVGDSHFLNEGHVALRFLPAHKKTFYFLDIGPGQDVGWFIRRIIDKYFVDNKEGVLT